MKELLAFGNGPVKIAFKVLYTRYVLRERYMYTCSTPIGLLLIAVGPVGHRSLIFQRLLYCYF